GLGITPEFHRMRDLYRSGALDKQIDLVLRNAETIRAIHKRVANVDHPEGWLPVAVICENCGRIGTTLATDYDGTTVAYECKPDPPPGLQHEFFTVGGKKMASSKGIGAEAVEIVAIYPPEVVRFLMLRTHPKRHLEFDPAGMTLPRLMDEYDRAADAYRGDE